RIRRYLDGAFCLTYGDGVGDVNIDALLRFHRSHGRLATVTAVRPPGRFGELQVEGRRVTSYSEKPQITEGFISGGVFLFERGFVGRYLEDWGGLVLEKKTLGRLAAGGELMVWQHTGFWQPMDTFREWKMLEELWSKGEAPWKIWE